MARMPPKSTSSQRGSALIEFAIVGPIITAMGMALLQYAMLFTSKSHINHATFMAARAGSTGNASLITVEDAYIKALVPLYGGGKDMAELALTYGRAKADLSSGGFLRIDILNPSKESFDDFADPALKDKYKARAIANANQAFAGKLTKVGDKSGQTLQDANLLKLQVTHGYKLKVPIVSNIYLGALRLTDTGQDAFYTQLIRNGRIPVISHVTVAMQSDPVENSAMVSLPGQGNQGKPSEPGTPGEPTTPVPPTPQCPTSGCTNPPGINGDPEDPTNQDPSVYGYCPVTATVETLDADPLFAFGKSDLSSEGTKSLDQLIARAKEMDLQSVRLIGYTDPLGTISGNNKLSLERAQSVRTYLQKNGFPAVPITVEGKGSADLVVELADCPKSGQAQIDCLAPNRRVEVKLFENPPK
jgi:outer membrane protein OmpA-like peptidoglycan-associated protein